MPDPYDQPREVHFPLYVKAPLILLGLALVVFTLHIASDIIFPLFFAAIFAIMLHPVEQWLLRRRVPPLLAITLTVVLGVAALLGLFYFIYLEATQLSDQLPLFKKKFAQTTAQVHQWLQDQFGISDQKLQGWVSEAGNRASSLLGGTLSAVSGLLVVATLIPRPETAAAGRVISTGSRAGEAAAGAAASTACIDKQHSRTGSVIRRILGTGFFMLSSWVGD